MPPESDPFWTESDSLWHAAQEPQTYAAPPFKVERREPQEGDVYFELDQYGRQTARRVGDVKLPKRGRSAVEMKTKEVSLMGSKDAAVEELTKALIKYGKIQSLLDRFNGEQPPVGTVLRWVKSFKGGAGELIVEGVTGVNDLSKAVSFKVQADQEFIYVAFRAPDGAWYSTSQRGATKHDWDQLLKIIDDSPCELAGKWIEVPAPAKVEESALNPEAWAEAMFGAKTRAVATEDEKDASTEE